MAHAPGDQENQENEATAHEIEAVMAFLGLPNCGRAAGETTSSVRETMPRFQMTPLQLIVSILMVGLTANSTTATFAPEDYQCSASDYSAGPGGQDVECSLQCGKNAPMELHVSAVDPGASVEGRLECPVNAVWCDAIKKCDAAGISTREGSGHCEAHSFEYWDDGLYVRCKAEPPQFCQGRFCFPAAGNPSNCYSTVPQGCGFVSDPVSVYVFAKRAQSFVLECSAAGCTVAQAMCTTDPMGYSCSSAELVPNTRVPATSETLAAACARIELCEALEQHVLTLDPYSCEFAQLDTHCVGSFLPRCGIVLGANGRLHLDHRCSMPEKYVWDLW